MEREGSSDALAIVGLAAKFPSEATNTDNLWKFLLSGRCASTPWPEDRFGKGHYHPDPEHGGTHAVKGGHFLTENPANFDAPFFNITKGEAGIMDPQQRVVLENVYQALENAGISLEKAKGSNTSVFVSGFNQDHVSNVGQDTETTHRYRTTGLTNCMLSNRVSWFFDFKGPSVTLDTACSSSMTALHLSCQSLLTGESDMAVASGVTILGHPGDINAMSHQGFLGPDGRCYSFDHRANGYARGEGAGSVIVKRLNDAIRDGDTIRAVIRGTGVNQDGRTPGLTLPDSDAQERLMRRVYSTARLTMDDTMMVEAHGTGTAAGDPIEAAAIARCFAPTRRGKTPLYVGAMKSGLGHLEGAAGIAGIIKAVLILENAIIPPNVNFEKPNPKIPVQKWNLQFPLAATPVPTSNLRRISVNSFGVGGTNAHAVLDDAFHYLKENGLQARHATATRVPTAEEVQSLVQSLTGSSPSAQQNETLTNGSKEPTVNGNGCSLPQDGATTNGTTGQVANGHSDAAFDWDAFGPVHQPPKMLIMSAFDEAGVTRVAEGLADYLEKTETHLDAADVAHTLSLRTQFPWRSFALGATGTALKATAPAVRARGSVNIGLVFTGQGAQWYAMGRELLCYPVFRESLLQASSYFKSLGAEWSLLDELARPKETSQLDQAFLSQPACTALQIAVVDLLRCWGILPTRVVGHSSGEIAAAYCAGKLSSKSAWKVAYFRGLVCGQESTSAGAMMAVGLGEEAVESLVQGVRDQFEPSKHLVVACINSPSSTTISGDVELVDALKLRLDAEGVFARKLKIEKAYHSPHMGKLSNQYLELLGQLSSDEEELLQTPNITMISSVTGNQVDAHQLDADYWVSNLVSPVKFSQALDRLCFSRLDEKQAPLRANTSGGNSFADVLVEVGPHGALQSAIKQTVAARPEGASMLSLPVLNRSAPGASTLLTVVGSLFCRGYSINVNLVNGLSAPGSSASPSPRLLTSLPSYPFNHSQEFWYESRLTRNFRLRKHERHDLLGAPVADWNKEVPRWRHFIRVSEQPWLRDHIVTNAIVWPGVAYLTGVIEAARQLAEFDDGVKGFRLANICLKKALIVPDTKDGIEVQWALARMDESSHEGSSVWRRFEVTSYNAVADDWTVHCTGYVAVDYETTTGEVDGGREAREERAAHATQQREWEGTCTVPFDMDRTYDNLATIGLDFGPLFRNISQVQGTQTRKGQVVGTITVPDIASIMPKNYVSPHVIHPATFDSCVHFALAAMMDQMGTTNLEAPAVPTFIHEVQVSAKSPYLTAQPGHRVRVQGETELIAYEKYQSHITVWDEATGERLISVRKLRATPLDSSGGVDTSSVSETRKLCHKLEWHPYLNLLTNEALHRDVVPVDVEARTRGNSRLQLAALLLVSDALDELVQSGFTLDNADLPPHLKRYFDWMKYLDSSIHENKVSLIDQSEFARLKQDPDAKQKLYQTVQSYSANGELAVRLGSNIAEVYRGNVDPLHLMFGQDDILDRVYAEVANQNELPLLQQRFLGFMASNCANLAVLEVGAGVGSSTFGLLKALAPVDSETGKRMIGHQCAVTKYTYTDISSAFFEKAREKFAAYQDVMEYRVLDAEKDVVDQGFENGTYDLVVAQNVVHATADLKATLSNLRKLLKPGGRLFLQEGTRQDYFWSSIAFGQLSGWWLGVEPFRQWSPWISSSQWNDVLTSSGYSSAILEMKDSQHPDLHTQSVFVAQSPHQASPAINEAGNNRAWKRVVLITNGPGSSSEVLGQRLESLLRNLRATTMLLQIDQLGDVDFSHDLCLCLAELDHPLLAELCPDRYEAVKKMLTVCKGLLWVTGDTTEDPHYGMILGLMRSNRWERDLDEANLVTLSIAEPKPDVAQLTENIAKLWQEQFFASSSAESSTAQGEFMLRNDEFLTSRLHTNSEANQFLTSRLEKPRPVATLLKDAGRPIKLSVASPGLLDRLEWVTDEVYDESLAPTHVEVQVKAVGLNFRDLMIAMGEHMAISIGCEAAGVVSRVGSEVSEFEVGDRVMYITGLDNVGCLRTYGRIDSSVLSKLPDGLSFEDAAGLPCVYATAIFSLREAGRLAKGEKILIHAAAGGVGQAAIRYAQWIGAEVFATVSTTIKKQLLMDEFGIPESHIFSSRDLSFVKGIKRATNGYGVDVVLNSLSGEALRRSWDLIAPFGRFVEIGKKDAQINGKVDLHQFLNHVTMCSVDLSTMMRHKPVLIKRMLDETMRLWNEGVAKPANPTTIMKMSQVEEGLRLLQSGKGMGKIIVVPSADDVLPIVPATPAPYALRPNATYFLSGGLGGIGRSMARWMAVHGAKHFVFLSSSGNVTEPVSKMKGELEAAGCAVHIFRCDVSDRERVAQVLEECKQLHLPPIKGVIQGAMKLKDSMFENMTHDMWQAAVKPKVQGSWNLHELLPRDLDHFVMLSSATGVLGNRSQANYAAGNTFQDALAVHRRYSGLAACTIDVGTVIGVGYVAENLDRVAINKHFNTVLETISEDELHLLMEYAMTGSSGNGAPAQLVTGLSDMESYRRRGVPPPTFLGYPLFTRLRQIEPSSSSSSSQGDQGDGSAAIASRLGAAQSLDEAAEVVTDAIVGKLSSLLSISVDDINADKSVSAHGVDSLVAMEFRTFLARVIKADVPVLEIMDTLSIRQLSRNVAKVSKAVHIAGESNTE